MTFATRLAVFFSLIYLISGAVLVYYIYSSNVSILDNQIRSNLQDLAYHTMDKVDRMLFEKYADLKLLATDSIIMSRESTPDRITARLRAFAENYNTYTSLSLFDMDRTCIADTNGTDIGKRDPLNALWNKIYEHNNFVMNIFRHGPSGLILFNFAVVVKDRDGSPFAVLVSRASLNAELYQITNRAAGIRHQGEQDLKVELVDRNGLILYSSYRPAEVLNVVTPDREYLKKMVAEGSMLTSGGHDHSGIGEELHVFAQEQGYLDFKGDDWILLLHFPKKLAFAPAHELRNRMILVLFSVGAFTMLCLFFLSHSVTKPIAELSRASFEVAGGNLDIRVESKSKDELGKLTIAFNRMVTDLREYRERLLGSNKELEAKVAERTAELETINEQLMTYQENLRSLASQLALAEDGERRRIAMDLHDQIGQKMALIMIKLDTLSEAIISSDLAKPFNELRELVEQTIVDTRSLTYKISSPILYEMGLEAALEWLGEQMNKQYGVICIYTNDQQAKPLSNDIGIILFRSVNELLTNVVKHAKTAEVLLSVDREGDNIRITVEDNGIGFDTFKISDYSRQAGGFGLFSIRERLHSIGGSAEIMSKPGHGTRAILVAPLRIDAGKGENTQERQNLMWKGRGGAIRILIADDHKMVRDGLRVLMEMDPEVEVVAEAESGRMAVQLTRELLPDVVVMDVTMPDLGGIEATERILGENRAVKVIGLSMHSDERFVAGMLKAGASGYVLKHAAFGELAQAIRAVVANRKYVSTQIKGAAGSGHSLEASVSE